MEILKDRRANSGRVRRELTQLWQQSRRDPQRLQVSDEVTVFRGRLLLGGGPVSGRLLMSVHRVQELLKSQRSLEVIGIFTVPPSGVRRCDRQKPKLTAGSWKTEPFTDVSATFHARTSRISCIGKAAG
jgi:hypothetical protein